MDEGWGMEDGRTGEEGAMDQKERQQLVGMEAGAGLLAPDAEPRAVKAKEEEEEQAEEEDDEDAHAKSLWHASVLRNSGQPPRIRPAPSASHQMPAAP
jgi:hypothetical protein